MVQIYTGNGKGKTTAALGLILRALGREKKVCLIQFMKKNYTYGEILFFEKYSIPIDIYQFGTDQLVDPENPAEIDFKEAKAAIEKAFEVICSNQFDLVILDEINVAVKWNLITVEEQKKIFNLSTKSEIVMTGRYLSKEIAELADLVSEIKEVKHYFSNGINARKGIEY